MQEAKLVRFCCGNVQIHLYCHILPKHHRNVKLFFFEKYLVKQNVQLLIVGRLHLVQA